MQSKMNANFFFRFQKTILGLKKAMNEYHKIDETMSSESQTIK